jgi:molybdopterin/thiamine biosynthesis adenylyltransferase
VTSREEALSRTTRLINQHYFDGEADESAIAVGLGATTVRLLGNADNLSSRSGQAAFVTAFQLITRMGIGIELQAPEAALVAEVVPLRHSTLRAALLDLGSDLVPDTVVREQPGEAQVTFAFGDTSCANGSPIFVTASDLGCLLTREETERARLVCDFPLGGLAAAAAAAAIALTEALPQIEQATGMKRASRRHPSPGPPVRIELAKLFPTLRPCAAYLGRVDAISAGAVTNALVAVLSWLPEVSAALRAIDDDGVEIHNLNRCLQFRAGDNRKSKVDALRGSSSGLIEIDGIKARLTPESLAGIAPLADRVVAGVDNSKARWFVQEQWPPHLYIGATSNQEAVLTTHHPGEPCAGCAHPDPLPEGEMVPTISFVSFWAGLLQACALLVEAERPQPAQRVTMYPFALGQSNWGRAAELPTAGRCAIHCPVSDEIDLHKEGSDRSSTSSAETRQAASRPEARPGAGQPGALSASPDYPPEPRGTD